MLKLKGGQKLSGSVTISGSKNAALPLIAAALLFKKSTLHNVPRIGDIFSILEIIKSLNVDVSFDGNTLIFDSSRMNAENMNRDLAKKIRASILLLAPLLTRLGFVELPYPGGCNIGKRPIDEHINGFTGLGYKDSTNDEFVVLAGRPKEGDVHLYAQFAVTATENMITASVLRPGKTFIHLAAIEPHVMNLVGFLCHAGAKIAVRHDHTIEIEGVEKLVEEVEFEVISDYIESGTFIVLGALCSREYIDIHRARIDDLTIYLQKCREVGVAFDDLGNDILRVYRSEKLKPINIQTNIYPGFPTDLQSPFAILLTQADGISRIQEIMFEGRLNYLVEIEKMRGHPAIMNPHEAMIFGKTQLRGTTVASWDLRAGVAMIIAGLIATGETSITNVAYIERGYEDIIGKMRGLGVEIEKVGEE